MHAKSKIPDGPKVAPLLAAGLSVRAIWAESGIPVGAVHRAKRQLEMCSTEDKRLPPRLISAWWQRRKY